MNDDKFRSFIGYLKGCCHSENEIMLFYDLNSNTLDINNEYVRLKYFSKFSLSNFNKLLSMIKNDYEMKYYGRKIKVIEIYN